MNGDTIAKTNCDLLVKNACLITVDEQRRIFANGAVAISGTHIVAVGDSDEVLANFTANQVVDACGGIVHPGFVEPHIHISQYHSRAAASVFQLPEPPFRYAAWKAELLPEDEYPSTLLGCLELLKAGFTSYVEPGTAFSPDEVAAATEAAGMRAWVTDPYMWDQGETLKLYPALISDKLLERVPCDTDRCLAELGRQLYRNRDADALVKGHVAIYGEATATDALRLAAKACARDNGVTFTEHLCFAPVIDAVERERLGKTQVEHAHSLGILDAATTAVHMNSLYDQDMEIIRETDISIVWNAANYLAVAAGAGVKSRLPELYRAGVTVALGIDTPGSTNPGDTATVAYLAAREAGTYVTWPQLLEMQTIAAARSIGADHDIGSLTVGKRADLVMRDGNDTAALGFDPVYELMLFQRSRNIDTVVVNGEIVMRAGQATRVDSNQVVAHARESMQRIIGRIGMTPQCGWPIIGAGQSA